MSAKNLSNEDLNLNRAGQQIADMNMELKQFLTTFRQFEAKNIIDKNLFTNLTTLSREIESFIDRDPKLLTTDQKTEISVDFLKQNGIVRVYACDVCETEIGNRSREILKHIQFDPRHKILEKRHKERLLNGHADLKKQNFPNEKSDAAIKQRVRDEKSRNDRRDTKKKNQLKMSRRLPKKAKAFLEKDFGKFLSDSAQLGTKLKNIPAYGDIEQSILKAVKPLYPNAKIHFFGSRINGLGNAESDLDIFLEIGDVFNIHDVQTQDTLKKLKAVSNVLKKQTNEWKNFIEITSARVPILKAFHFVNRIDCDIGFSNGLGRQNTLLAKYYFELQPICQKMGIFVKKWLAVTTLKNQFTTYTFVLMIFFFMQSKNALPTVKDLQSNINHPFEIGPWQGDFIEKQLQDFQMTKIADNNKNCLEYLKEFFKFCLNFNYSENIITPYIGKALSKKKFNTQEITRFPRYEAYYKLDPKNNTLKLDSPICVQDPFELNHNVAKAITPGLLDLMLHYCAETVTELALKTASL